MAFKHYIDQLFFQNPLQQYIKWLSLKIRYQTAYWGSHLRLGYKCSINNVTFGKFNWIAKNAVVFNTHMGHYSYVNEGSVVLNCTIGKFCSIGPNVRIAPGNHPTKKIVSTHPSIYSNPPYFLKNFSIKDNYPESMKEVKIGNDVWIAANAVITDGIIIGDGAIVAANSVVTKNVAPYSIVGGIPAKHIRYRFAEEQIEKLLKEKWWDKDFEWIEKNVEFLLDIGKYEQWHY